MKPKPKPKRDRPNKRKAIQNALGQLGWQASGKDVIAWLADYGIEVSEGLISRMKLESLKKSDALKLKQMKSDQMARQRRTKSIIKLPQRRTYWRGGSSRGV
jgi:hypothetical protein